MKLTLQSLINSTLVLCPLLLGAAGAFAADASKLQTERGIIKSVDTPGHWLVITDPKDKTEHKYQWNDQTRFMEHGRAIGHKTVSAAGLKDGMRVSVTYAPG